MRVALLVNPLAHLARGSRFLKRIVDAVTAERPGRVLYGPAHQ